MRVWDAFFCEGAKVLLRYAVALLKARAHPSPRVDAAALTTLCTPVQLNEVRLSRETDAGALVAQLKEAVANAHDRDALMLVAFNGIGSMPMARILRLRADATVEVEAERAALAARRAARSG